MSNSQLTVEPPAPKTPALRTPAPPERSLLGRVYDLLTSLKLTVVFLGLATLLVFIGTIRQVDEGLFDAQNRYFRSLLIWWQPHGANWRIPVLPGGYFVGGVLLVNLILSYARRFKLTKKKIGLLVIHVGLVLLLVGQFLTDFLSRESHMRLAEGEAKNYSESFRDNELVLIDKSDSARDRVYSIPESRLKDRGEIRDGQLPFTLRVKNYWPNMAQPIEPTGTMPPMAKVTGATAGSYKDLLVFPQPPVKETDLRDMPGVVIELLNGGRSVGSFFIGEWLSPDAITVNGKQYEIAMRPTRYYKPFSLELLKFTHERYTGTDTPKNFASRVSIKNPKTGEAREVLIYMNNPLRYSGETFYQSGFAPDNDERVKKVTILQVVRNPSWLTPYLACILVFGGLLIQFGQHLIGFVRRRSA